LEQTPYENQQHTVSIDYPLAVSAYEISRTQYAEFVRARNYESRGCVTYEENVWRLRKKRNWRDPGFSQSDTNPVTCVSWYDARQYAHWLSKTTGKHYRLLSSSEWEYMARADTRTDRYWGNSPDRACDFANVADGSAERIYPGWRVHPCRDGHIHTAPVTAFKPNAFGVYGALGNVFEWVEDCWNDSYRSAPLNGSAWTQGNCQQRVLRGGSWFSQPAYVRAAYRNRFKADTRSSTFGIRVARDLEMLPQLSNERKTQ